VFHIHIWKGWAHQCLPWRLGRFKFRLCCHYL